MPRGVAVPGALDCRTVDCYACDQPAINACRRCAKPYCEDHGNASYCAGCLEPASALPSFNLYRIALLVMLVGTAVAVYLLIRPPGDTGDAAPVVVGRSAPTPTSEAERSPQATATAAVDEPPQSSGTETAATATPAASPTPATTPVATPTSQFREYVVREGDTLYGIAQATLPPGDDIAAYVQAIATLNQIDVDAPLTVGTKIALPPLP